MQGEFSMGSTQIELKIVDRRLVCFQHYHFLRACRKAALLSTGRTAETLKEDRQ